MLYACGCCLVVLIMECSGNKSGGGIENILTEEAGSPIEVKAKVIYPKSREWASPSGGMEAKFNPPSMVWPVVKDSKYSVRLSQDPHFKEGVLLRENIPYAMFNAHKKLAEGTWYWQVKDNIGWSTTKTFAIGKKTKNFLTPEPSKLIEMITKDNPRVYAWKLQLEELRTKAKGYQEASQILL